MGSEAAPSPERQQAKMKEFLQVLPLTLEIAGLPRAEIGKNYNEGQMEVRVSTIKLAHKLAKQLLLEVSNK